MTTAPPTTPLGDFDAATALQPQQAGFSAQIDADWLQGRTAFGGLGAAIALRAAQRVVADAGSQPPLRSVDVDFLAPIAAGAVEVQANILRAGRAITWAEATVAQDGRVATRLRAVFATARPSAVRVPPPTATPATAADAAVAMPYIEGVVPRFVRNYEMRWGSGPMPFRGGSASHIDGWVRSRGPATGAPALLGLLDAWPAPVLGLLTAPAPASTVRWSVQLLDPEAVAALDGQQLFHYRSDAVAAADGAVTFTARLADASGRVLAISEQLAVVFDQR